MFFAIFEKNITMQTEAIFDNIAERIIEEIEKAEDSIYIAVAWFTNRNIFDKLLLKSENCKVQIIISDDEINNNSFVNFDSLIKNNGTVYKVGNGSTELMHNKFCIIDYNTIITGSYNWSYKAENNFENIIIHSEDYELANQFVNEFKLIVKKYYPKTEKINFDLPIEKIIKRLEIIKNLIVLEEVEEIETNTKKLKELSRSEDLELIFKSLINKEYSTSIELIQKYISNFQQLSIWNDPEISSLKLEIKLLEHEINAFENEKFDIEKTINEFNHRHTIELGGLILEILNLRKTFFKDQQTKFKEAEEDFNNYNNYYEAEKQKEVFEITIEEKKELKKLYKNASILCHPDKFINESIEIQQQAEELFKELNEANSKNNIKRVTEILENLKKGILKPNAGGKISDKERLKETLVQLKNKLIQLEKNLKDLKESETYQSIININDWENYFAENKELLQKELNDLKDGE